MKCIVRILALLVMLTLVLPAAADTSYDPIDKWLQGNAPAPAPYAPDPEAYLPDKAGYQDESLSITIETTYWTDDIVQVDAPANGVTAVMLIRVKLSDVTQFRAAWAAKGLTKETERVTNMADLNNAVLAINGDFISYHDSGIAYRNGRQFRFNANNLRDLLIVDQEGDFHYLLPTSQKAWDEYIAAGGTVLHTYWFGPNLITEDGEPLPRITKDTVNNGPWEKAQRLVIGQTGELEYLIVCCEGPESTDYSGQGFTLEQMAKLCHALGMTNAYNLDGGSSCTVVLNGEKINSPSNTIHREVGDCIYFCTLVPN